MTLERWGMLMSDTAYALGVVFSALLMPAVLFFLFSFLVKGKQAIAALCESLPNTITNLLLITINTIVVSPIIVLVHFKVMSTIDVVIWEGAPHLAVIFCAIFAGDLIGYWRHRLEHSALLWPSHAIHHSDTKMSWLSLERFHPFNRLTTYVIDNAFLMLLGFPSYALIANNFIRHYYGFFIHADLPWSYGKLGKVFVSPVMHRWHHAAERTAHNTNYATIFSVFDLCFGTYRVPGPCDSPLGVTDKTLSNNVLSQLLYPIKIGSYRRLQSKN
jgi:sterol desaturase/sphingolipid hydroxylase (fatty acid hydroxylase superfamily)